MKQETRKIEYVTIFRTYITLKNGRRLYAHNYGLKAFPLRVPAPPRLLYPKSRMLTS